MILAFLAADSLWLAMGFLLGEWNLVSSPTSVSLLVILNLGSLGAGLFYITARFHYQTSLDLNKQIEILLDKLPLPEFFLLGCRELLILLDADDRIIYSSPSLNATLGFDPTTLREQSWSLIDPTHYPGKFRDIREKISQDMGCEIIQDLRPKEGPFITVHILYKISPWPSPDTLALFIWPVTEENRSLKEIQKDLDHQSKIWNALPPLLIRDQEGRELIENQAFRQLKAQAGGNLVLPGYLKTSDQLGGGYWEIPLSGQPEAFEVLRFSLQDHWGSLFLKATSRRDQEWILRESQAFLQTTIRQSPLGIIILDAKSTRIKICNDGAKEILGIPINLEMTGLPLYMEPLSWEVIDLERIPYTLENNPFFRVFSHPVSTTNQVIIRRKDGRELYVVLTCAPIYDQNGKFFAAFLAMVDASELHKTEKQLQDLNKDLENRVELRTRELVETQKHLMEAEKLAGLGSLVAGVAHEINTPVGVGVTAASFLFEATAELKKTMDQGLMKKSDLESYLVTAHESTRIILSNMARASNLIKSFKMISVDQSSDLQRKFRFKEYLEDIFRSLPSPNRKIQLQIQIEGDGELELNSYPGAFSQIITNLYMNSCTHGFENRVQGIIGLNFLRDQDKLILTYTDDGIGMEEPTLARVFDPFFTTRRNSGGTGLGMNIVFNLVNSKLGGRIKAESQPGEGVKFHIHLPLEPPQPAVNPVEFH